MTTDITTTDEKFTIEGGQLVRAVFPKYGQPYVHRCNLQTFIDVCHAIDETGQAFTGEDLIRITDYPSTQVFTAVAFLKEVGTIRPVAHKRHMAATKDTGLDGMIEWKALEEGSERIEILPPSPGMTDAAG